MKRGLYWEAWKLLPLVAKILFVAALGISGFIYWSGTQATVGQEGCIPSVGCQIVTSDAVLITKIEGLGLMGTMTGIFIVSIILIASTLEKHPDKIPVSIPKTGKSRFANPKVGIASVFGSLVVFALAFLDTFRLLTGYYSGDTSYVQFGIFAWFCVAIGLLLIGLGSITLWLQTKNPKPPSIR